jgi:hypothetical protein
MTAKTSRDENIIERRESIRANRVLEVKHRLIKRNGRKREGLWSMSTTKNMSVCGLLFLSPVSYQSGDIIELEVVMSSVIDIYKGQAQVVRVHEASGSSFDVAAKYVEVKFKPRPAKTHLKK